MELNVKDVITLNDNDEYAVASKIVFESKNYVYLINLKNKSDLKVCLQEDTILTDVDNPELLVILMPLFSSDMNSD